MDPSVLEGSWRGGWVTHFNRSGWFSCAQKEPHVCCHYIYGCNAITSPVKPLSLSPSHSHMIMFFCLLSLRVVCRGADEQITLWWAQQRAGRCQTGQGRHFGKKKKNNNPGLLGAEQLRRTRFHIILYILCHASSGTSLDVQHPLSHNNQDQLWLMCSKLSTAAQCDSYNFINKSL